MARLRALLSVLVHGEVRIDCVYVKARDRNADLEACVPLAVPVSTIDAAEARKLPPEDVAATVRLLGPELDEASLSDLSERIRRLPGGEARAVIGISAVDAASCGDVVRVAALIDRLGYRFEAMVRDFVLPDVLALRLPEGPPPAPPESADANAGDPRLCALVDQARRTAPAPGTAPFEWIGGPR